MTFEQHINKSSDTTSTNQTNPESNKAAAKFTEELFRQGASYLNIKADVPAKEQSPNIACGLTTENLINLRFENGGSGQPVTPELQKILKDNCGDKATPDRFLADEKSHLVSQGQLAEKHPDYFYPNELQKLLELKKSMPNLFKP